MSYRIVIGAPSRESIEEIATLTGEAEEIRVIGTGTTDAEILALLGTEEVDAVLAHEELGPLPVLDLAREILGRYPDVGVVLMSRSPSAEMLRAALDTGVRGVVGAPPALEEIQSTVAATARWAQSVRARLSGKLSDALGDLGGSMVVVAGAKGGVGTTTVAVHLAVAAQGANPRRSVCLVDLDLQAGDVRSLLDLTHRRSIGDLIEVADDINARQLDDSLYLHPSGMRIMLPPRDGEQAEDVTGHVARRILGAIRSRFDVVIVDTGTQVTEASAVAVEMAGQVLVVTTPDVLSLRAANRLVGLWERLQIRKDGIDVLVNRASRESEVQPELAGKVLTVPLLKTTVPSDFRSLEAPTNTGAPDRLASGPIRRAIDKLAGELELVRPGAEDEPGRAERRGRSKQQQRLRGDAGHVAVEAMGMTFPILVVLALLWEVVLVGTTFVLAGNSAREGARELAVGGPVRSAAEEVLPQSWRDTMRLETTGDRVTVSVQVPLLLPRMYTPFRISVGAGTVREQASGTTTTPAGPLLAGEVTATW
jgi:pilus assembly protein CpaE